MKPPLLVTGEEEDQLFALMAFEESPFSGFEFLIRKGEPNKIIHNLPPIINNY